MKKKLLLLLPLLLLTLASCTGYDNAADIKNHIINNQSGFVTLCEHNDCYSFIRDTYTDNIYVRYYEGHGYGGGGSFSPYYNAEGQIMKYSEFVEVHKH